MDPERQVNVGRYLKFVVAFLLIMFTALGAYEYYYGMEARKLEQLQREYMLDLEKDSAATTAPGTR